MNKKFQKLVSTSWVNLNSQVCLLPEWLANTYLYNTYAIFIGRAIAQLRYINTIIIISRCFQERKILFRSLRRIFAFRPLRKLSTRPPTMLPVGRVWFGEERTIATGGSTNYKHNGIRRKAGQECMAYTHAHIFQ